MQKKLFSHIMTAAIPTTLATILPVTLSLASPMTVQAASGNDFRPEIVCPSGTEIQVEYLRHSMFKDREIDNYTIHCFRKFHQKGALSWHKGWTLTRATGYTTEDGIRRDSNAWGTGPALMVRWERPWRGKATVSLDGSGSALVYNRNFPAQGRPFGFYWRLLPQIHYHADRHNTISLGYTLMHASNGLRTRNPGHNGIGFVLGWRQDL